MTDKERAKAQIKKLEQMPPQVAVLIYELGLEMEQGSSAIIGLGMHNFDALLAYLKMEHRLPMSKELANALIQAIEGNPELPDKPVLSFVDPSKVSSIGSYRDKKNKKTKRSFIVRRAFLEAGGLERNGYDNAIEVAAKAASVSRTTVTGIVTKKFCNDLRKKLSKLQSQGMTLAEAYDEIAPPWESVEAAALGRTDAWVQKRRQKLWRSLLEIIP